MLIPFEVYNMFVPKLTEQLHFLHGFLQSFSISLGGEFLDGVSFVSFLDDPEHDDSETPPADFLDFFPLEV